MPRYVTPQDNDPRSRFGIYRLCDCPTCEGRGKGHFPLDGYEAGDQVRCPDCRGEGRIRQELASCETSEALGVALVTLAREEEFRECPLGLLERGAGKDGAGRWLVLPWLPSPRNVSDAGRVLARSKKSTP